MTGIICVNKPQDITSRTVTNKIKYIFHEKTGHSGTLDPLASGVLPILIGTATKLSDYMPTDKRYTAVISLGVKTDTGDITGAIIQEKQVKEVSKEEIEEALKSMLGVSMQTPPMYSAIKHNGQNLYSIARQGITIDREEREIEISKIDLISHTKTEIEFSVCCEKGTYIRTLCEDIAEKLSNVGTMKSLCRTKSCGIELENCIEFDEVVNNDILDITKKIISPESYLSFLKKIIIPDSGLKYFKNGGFIEAKRLNEQNLNMIMNFHMRAYSVLNEFIGIAEVYTINNQSGVKLVWANEIQKEKAV